MGLEACIELVVSWGDQMEHVTSKSDASAISTELAERRTGMSFQRTRMSADRALISVIRTSLSLISFGFTIFPVFQKLHDQNVLSGAAPARNFGVTLVLLGIVMLVLGIVYHPQFMLELRALRRTMTAEGLGPRREQVPALADADHREDPASDWRRRHPQHGVQDWTARLIRASKGGLKWR
jgi:putative membrane protein